MEGIHPKFILSKRFPVHAAVEQLNLDSLEQLLTPASDAKFHFGRKINGTDISVLHQACATKTVGKGFEERAVAEIVRVVIQLGHPHSDKDQIGQTPLFYAVSHYIGEHLVPILLRGGANPNVKRNVDDWSPLFIAAMLGKSKIANMLLQSGADPSLEDSEGRTAEDIAREYKHYATADIIASPRRKYRPEFPTQWSDLLETSLNDDCLILWDEHIDWRGKDGLTLLHVAAWTGNLNLFRAFCNDVKGRKLLPLSTVAGLTPLSLAIINGQTNIVEEYFQHRVAKKSIYFQSDVIKATKETIPHLLFHYCPLVHPKCLLKRKDLTSDLVNLQDNKGNSPLLVCAIKNSRDTLRRLLSSKAANERSLFDLSVQNQYGKNILHYLVMNEDRHNINLILNLLDRSSIKSVNLLNSLDVSDLSPIQLCIKQGHQDIVAMILKHPVAKELVNVEQKDKSGKSLLHHVGERGLLSLWDLIYARDDFDHLATDNDGNTALMSTVAAGQSDIFAKWLKTINEPRKLDFQLTLQNEAGLNLFMLVIKHMPDTVIEKFIDTFDLSVCIDQKDKSRLTSLLHLCAVEKWVAMKHLLNNSKIDDVIVDIHPTDKLGHSCLVHVLIAKANADRQHQNFKMKNDIVKTKLYHKESERLWSLVQLLLQKERDSHGTNVTTGKEAGIKCIKEQLEANRKIRPPVPDEVIKEFSNLYNVVFKAKKKPAPPPEKPIEKPKAAPAVSAFQQKMNDIYKNAQNKRDENNVLESLKLEKNVKPKVKEKINFNDMDWECDESELVTHKKPEPPKVVEIKETPIEVKVEPKSEAEPSIQDLRALWRTKKKEEPVVKKEDTFSSNDFFESILKKAEKDADEKKCTAVNDEGEDKELAERMNEEIAWALQQKQEAQVASGEKKETKPVIKQSEPKKPEVKNEDPIVSLLSSLASKPSNPKPKDNIREAKKDQVKSEALDFLKMLNQPNSQISDDKKKSNDNPHIYKPKDHKENGSNDKTEVTSDALNFLKKLNQPKKQLSEEEKKAQEEKEIEELESAINEEIRWALEEKKRLEGERDKRISGVVESESKPAEKAISTPVSIEKEDPKKQEEERKKKADAERKRLEELQKQAEEMIKKMKEQQGPETSADETKSVKDNTKENKADLSDNKGSSKADTNKVENIATPEKKERKLPRQIDPPPEPKKPERFSPSMLRRRESKDKPMTIREKIELQKKREEERMKLFKEETGRKISSESTASENGSSNNNGAASNGKEKESPKDDTNKQAVINGVEIIDNKKEGETKTVPKWKRDKMIRERSTDESPKSETKLSENGSPVMDQEEINKLPRWKREKLERERKQSSENSSESNSSEPSPENRPKSPEVHGTNKNGNSTSSGDSLNYNSRNLLQTDPVPPSRKSPSPHPKADDLSTPDSRSPEINGSAPEPVRRRRRTDDNSVVNRTEDNGVVTRPNRKSKIDDTISKEEDINGLRSISTEIQTRPGYRDVAIQTDPVQTHSIGV